jgi:F-type H+-transporting ATPase subunit b
MRLRAISIGLLGTSALAASEGGGGASLIEPQLGTIFWTTITFLVLVVLLGREQAEALLRQQRELLEQARRERSEALSAGQRDAEKLKAEILAEARGQREQLLKQTEAQVQAGMRQARAELRELAADLAIQAAGKLLERNLDAATQKRLVEDYLRDLERSGPGSPTS